MSPGAFKEFWRREYPEAPPVAYILRERYIERWLRIHTLPGSKRYADDREEMNEVLQRHHTLLSDIFGTTEFVLVLTGASKTPEPRLSSAWLWEHYPDSQPFANAGRGDVSDTDDYWHFFMATRTYEPGAFDDLLRLVADDVIDNVLFVRTDVAAIYAPYDGGADIIAASSSTRDAMRQRYASWLSTHSTGL